MQTPGKYSATALILWSRQILEQQIGVTQDPLQALINLRDMNR